MLPSTLDPAYKNSTTTLSGGNLIATCGSGTNVPATGLGTPQLTTVYGTGKWYWEGIFTGAGTDFNAFGLGNTSTNLNNYAGSDTDSISSLQNGHTYYNNGDVSTSIGQSWFLGDHLQFAVDLINQRWWTKVNNGSWNNNPTNDPTANVGGQDISFLFSSTTFFRPTYTFGDTGTIYTVNFGGSPFYGSIPSGFQAANTWAGPVTPAYGQMLLCNI
jgi:hypothetical protein